ncbi:Protein CBG03926 [Caenorhabditis briggsae]|nr:Protein CBG03926 [Caenorhabditis briggsae]CAP24734.1 Protein CBG03926 [Caenorhabditis briggsae]
MIIVSFSSSDTTSSEAPYSATSPILTSTGQPTSSSSISTISCGSPDKSDEIVDVTFSPNRTFFFNAPFDINYMTFFKVRHPEYRRIAYRVSLEKSEKSTIVLPESNGMMEEKDWDGNVKIGYTEFEFDKLNFKNDSITIEWVNIPKEAQREAGFECFAVWFGEEVTPKNHTLKVQYNS